MCDNAVRSCAKLYKQSELDNGACRNRLDEFAKKLEESLKREEKLDSELSSWHRDPFKVGGLGIIIGLVVAGLVSK